MLSLGFLQEAGAETCAGTRHVPSVPLPNDSWEVEPRFSSACSHMLTEIPYRGGISLSGVFANLSTVLEM